MNYNEFNEEVILFRLWMKVIGIVFFLLIIIIGAFFLKCVWAESGTSIAIKGGYNLFSEYKESIFDHNHIYDNEWGFGAYVRYEKDGYFVRLDYDTLKTGDEFSSSTYPIPYEGVHVRLHSLTGTFGKKWEKGFYLGAGGGIGLNKWKILTYDVHPLEIDSDPTLILHALGGYERKIYKNWFGFIEGRGTWEEADLELREYRRHGDRKEFVRKADFDENLSRLSIFAGVGVNF